MLKALVVLLWLIGIAAILLLTLLVARRRPGPASATAPDNAPAESRGSDVLVALRGAGSSAIGMLLMLVVGAVAIYAAMCLLGVVVVHLGPHIDKPIYNWMLHHRVPFWKAVMKRLTKVGNTWTTWGAAAASAVCLAAFYRRDKWLPPVALGAAVVVDHYLTLALRHTFHRIGPPGSLGGTFPSGGCDRIFVFYGLIAYLIWREASGSRRVAIWSTGVVCALAFSEGYSRGYLTLHWFTDILSGIIYGALILGVFIVTIRMVIGPARKPGADAASTPLAAATTASTSVAADAVPAADASLTANAPLVAGPGAQTAGLPTQQAPILP